MEVNNISYVPACQVIVDISVDAIEGLRCFIWLVVVAKLAKLQGS
jgi:hypothetical protein